MNQHLGIIEGFYGKPWGFETREAMISFMTKHRYGFYVYAPKADIFLREQWQAPVPAVLLKKLQTLGEQLKAQNIQWGMGLSPFDAHQDFNEQVKEALLNKIEQISTLGVNWLAILFDDMKGDFPDLAATQIEICHFVKANSNFDKLLMCPSYYCFDPILEKVFGKMPENYLQDLGQHLEKNIEIFWTGEKVCSVDYSQAHLLHVENILQRKPFIWDNYPVNDGARMSPFLHVSAVTGRRYCTSEFVSGVAVNPMNEAFLSQIPLASFNTCLEDPANYDAENFFNNWVEHFLGPAAATFKIDRTLFEQSGLHALSTLEKQNLIKKYTLLSNEHNQSYMQDVIDYLQGKYLFDVKDSVPTQLLWEA